MIDERIVPIIIGLAVIGLGAIVIELLVLFHLVSLTEAWGNLSFAAPLLFLFLRGNRRK